MKLRKLARFPAVCILALLAACGDAPSSGAKAVLAPPAASVVSTHGRLHACGARICDAAGAPVQLKGMSWSSTSTGGSGARFYDANAVASLARGWGATVVRAAVGVTGVGGYLSDDRDENVARARALIDGAIAAGVYVVVDWHAHDLHQDEALAFFSELARAYADAPNLIWEPLHEPADTVSWEALKTYHQAVIAAIRAAGSENLVVVGTPSGSQDVDVAAADPITTDANVAYALHFRAGTHGQPLREKADAALRSGTALFVTEWSTCDESGSSGLDASASLAWTSWMDANGISSAGWALVDAAGPASALVPGGAASATGPWPDAQLTPSGQWMKGYVAREPPGTTFRLTVVNTGEDGAAGSVTDLGGQLQCGPTCSARYTSGTVVTLTATPADPSSRIFGWIAPCSGSGATCKVTLLQDQTVTVRFVRDERVPVTVTRTGGGSGTVLARGGISCGTLCAAMYAGGARVTLSAAADSGSVFTGWSGPCTGAAALCVVTVTEATSIGAAFAGATDASLRVMLAGTGAGRVTSGAGGIACPGSCAAAPPDGSAVTLTAEAVSGTTFAGWSGACAGAEPTCVVSAAPGRVVIARFDAAGPTLPLTVNLAGPGLGRITSSPPGIDCTASCTGSFAAGTTVTLTATEDFVPTYRAAFSGWAGSCTGASPTCVVTMTAGRTVGANFSAARPMASVNVAKDGSGTGQVMARGISCGPSCSSGYFVDEVVALTATAESGSRFAGWGGACSGSAPVCEVMVSGYLMNVSATFESVEPRNLLEVVIAGGGTGVVGSESFSSGCRSSCSAYVRAGQEVTLTASVAPESIFLGWGGACTGTSSTCTVAMTGARMVTATFQTTTAHPITVTAAGPGTVTSAPAGIDCGPDQTCGYAFLVDTLVTLTATAADGATFAGWTGECTGTDPCVLRVWDARSATAVFHDPTTYPLTVSTSTGALMMDVTSTPAGIDCGPTCVATFPSGTVVTLTAASRREDGCYSTFIGWGGACSGTGTCEVSITEAQTVLADYENGCPLFTLDVARSGTGAGTVTAGGGVDAGIDCGVTCSASYRLDEVVTLTAAAAPGSTFAGWSGACTGAAPTCTVTMAQRRAVTAAFTLAPAGGCKVTYSVTGQWPGGFGAALRIQNTGTTAWTGWTVSWTYPGTGQRITHVWNATGTQDGQAVTVKNLGYNATVRPGETYAGVGFTGAWSGSNPKPTAFSVNGIPCE